MSCSWKVDRTALREAREHLVIRQPVVVTASDKLPANVKGRYCGFKIMRGRPAHDVRIASRLSPEDASRCLWHELTHVSQFEDSPSTFHDDYERYMKRTRQMLKSGAKISEAYTSNPFELQAKANERLHDEVGTLMAARDGVQHIDTPEAALQRMSNLNHINNAMVRLSA